MSQAAKILIVDDDQELRELLLKRLTEYGFCPQAVANGTEMFEHLRRERVDLLLLDIMMPGEDGLALCRKLREPGQPYSDLPVIFLTALQELPDKVVGLEIGGDDYLPKPFETRELVARIRALLRRSRSNSSARAMDNSGALPPAAPSAEPGWWRFGLWRLNAPARHLIDESGVVIQLSAAEYRLLMLFLKNPQMVMSRDRIMDYMRDNQAEVYDRSIDVQISRLRTKLRDSGKDQELIRTMRGDGYMLAVPVQAGSL